MIRFSLSPFPYPEEPDSSTIKSSYRPSSLSTVLRQVKYFQQKVLSGKKDELIWADRETQYLF